jgi:quaternary ammonium compound-resistance protein SugE
MAWLFLLMAGTCEVAATTMYRYTDGLGRAGPTILLFVFAIASLYFLNRSLSGIPIGTAYAVWTGIGAAGTAILGVLAFGEAATLIRIALLTGLVACTVGLKFVTH